MRHTVSEHAGIQLADGPGFYPPPWIDPLRRPRRDHPRLRSRRSPRRRSTDVGRSRLRRRRHAAWAPHPCGRPPTARASPSAAVTVDPGRRPPSRAAPAVRRRAARPPWRGACDDVLDLGGSGQRVQVRGACRRHRARAPRGPPDGVGVARRLERRPRRVAQRLPALPIPCERPRRIDRVPGPRVVRLLGLEDLEHPLRTPRGERGDLAEVLGAQNERHGWYGGATPHPHRGTGACSATSVASPELWTASRVPHSA